MKKYSIVLVLMVGSLYGVFGKYRSTTYNQQDLSDLRARFEALKNASKPEVQLENGKRRKLNPVQEPSSQASLPTERR